jgi:hypothetical protein
MAYADEISHLKYEFNDSGDRSECSRPGPTYVIHHLLGRLLSLNRYGIIKSLSGNFPCVSSP